MTVTGKVCLTRPPTIYPSQAAQRREILQYTAIDECKRFVYRKMYDVQSDFLEKPVLEDMGIIYHRIRVAMPRHNGKAERQHRTDEKRFYRKMKMYSLADGRKQLLANNTKSNNTPKIC